MSPKSVEQSLKGKIAIRNSLELQTLTEIWYPWATVRIKVVNSIRNPVVFTIWGFLLRKSPEFTLKSLFHSVILIKGNISWVNLSQLIREFSQSWKFPFTMVASLVLGWVNGHCRSTSLLSQKGSWCSVNDSARNVILAMRKVPLLLQWAWILLHCGRKRKQQDYGITGVRGRKP